MKQIGKPVIVISLATLALVLMILALQEIRLIKLIEISKDLFTKSVVPDPGYERTYDILIYGLAAMFGYLSALFYETKPNLVAIVMIVCGVAIVIPGFITDHQLLGLFSGVTYIIAGVFSIFKK